jgi:hypothetical protein
MVIICRFRVKGAALRGALASCLDDKIACGPTVALSAVPLGRQAIELDYLRRRGDARTSRGKRPKSISAKDDGSGTTAMPQGAPTPEISISMFDPSRLARSI